ncbi:hypothetical protein [Streptacidiphilus sp. MAP12-16]|uniref:hypothetical protein n=1 Tax=Streptacidiphilus sp. MAP12-16 TaxID=3156300 RepID=UPI0035116F85
MSSKPAAPPAAAQAAQVRVLTDAYGLDAASRANLPNAILERQAHNARWWSSHLNRPGPVSPTTTRSPSASAGRSASTPTLRPITTSS